MEVEKPFQRQLTVAGLLQDDGQRWRRPELNDDDDIIVVRQRASGLCDNTRHDRFLQLRWVITLKLSWNGFRLKTVALPTSRVASWWINKERLTKIRCWRLNVLSSFLGKRLTFCARDQFRRLLWIFYVESSTFGPIYLRSSCVQSSTLNHLSWVPINVIASALVIGLHELWMAVLVPGNNLLLMQCTNNFLSMIRSHSLHIQDTNCHLFVNDGVPLTIGLQSHDPWQLFFQWVLPSTQKVSSREDQQPEKIFCTNSFGKN